MTRADLLTLIADLRANGVYEYEETQANGERVVLRLLPPPAEVTPAEEGEEVSPAERLKRAYRAGVDR